MTSTEGIYIIVQCCLHVYIYNLGEISTHLFCFELVRISRGKISTQ